MQTLGMKSRKVWFYETTIVLNREISNFTDPLHIDSAISTTNNQDRTHIICIYNQLDRSFIKKRSLLMGLSLIENSFMSHNFVEKIYM